MPAQRISESERRTRRERIDPRLKARGWTIVPFSEDPSLSGYTAHAIEEYPTAHGPADYALIVDGQLLGVVEAKKVTLGPQNVLTQAERYSKGVTGNSPYFDGCHVPFLYSTNGEIFWFQDVRHRLNRSRQIGGFHTPEALRELLARELENECAWFRKNANQHHRLRPYQIDANTAIEDAISKRKRQMLVAMATGTGKTFTLVNQVYRLLQAGVGKRVLFLVDRRALAAQAVRAFASFEPEPNKKFDKLYEVYSQRFQREDLDEGDTFNPHVLPKSYLEHPQPKHAYVYVCTIQRMAINLFGRGAVWGDEEIEEDAEELTIPHHAFDVVIADECHRGYDKALVDIISMVKHAAKATEPLLTAEERVTKAFDRLTANKNFTPDQQAWLTRIREHLIANLSIDEEDFDNVPILQNAGGWRNADRAFNGRLSSLLKDFNEVIAA